MNRRNDENTVRTGSGGGAFPWVVLVLVLALAGTAGFWGWQQLEQASTAALRSRREVDQLQAAVTTLTQQKGELAAQATELTDRLEEKEAALARLQATYTSLEEKMKAEIGRGDVRLSTVNGRIQVDLVDRILFDSGDAELSARGKEVLGRLGGVVAQLEDRQINVSGHTDDARISGKLAATYPTNWELSVARAVHVVRYLSESASVPSRRLVAAGYGEFHPVASNATAEGRSRNRRIEILLAPGLAPVRDAKRQALTSTAKPATAKPVAPKKLARSR